jgi:peptidoglycan/xylan/chitin deacetylase (PgdA/CDA1 family)
VKVTISFDYEVFFGVSTGSVEHCLLRPTERLLQMAQKHGVYFNFFIDTAFLIQMEYYAIRYPGLRHQYRQVTAQIKQMASTGHDIQLHIHPHWNDSFYDGNKWVVKAERYRLDQWEPDQIASMVKEQVAFLRQYSTTRVNAYRAGGWCLPDWNLVRKPFQENGIYIDSTLYSGGYLNEYPLTFDFRNVSKAEEWKFEEQPAVMDENGWFKEVPITSVELSPFFYWNLYGRGRLNKSLHKSMGDGFPITQKSTKRKLLTQCTTQALSTDGYYATLLEITHQKLIKSGAKRMVTIGHPKACSEFSLDKLDSFIKKVKYTSHFSRYSEE